jgi:hypothetical protein
MYIHHNLHQWCSLASKCMPLGMRKFLDWYLRVVPTKLNIIQACIPAGTIGTPAREIVFDFSDVQTCFHLGAMEMNLISMWCL